MPQPSTDLSLVQRLDALEEGAAFFRPLVEVGKADAFTLVYPNTLARELADEPSAFWSDASVQGVLGRAVVSGLPARASTATLDLTACPHADGVLLLLVPRPTNHLADLLDHLPVGVLTLRALRDSAGIIRDFRYGAGNLNSWRLIGLPRDPVGRTLLEVFPGLAPAGIFDAYARVVETGEPFEQELFYDADGLRNWYAVSATRLDDGLVVTFTDISDRRRAHAQLEEQAQLFDQVLNASLNGIITYQSVRDAQGRIVDFRAQTINQVSAALLNLPDQVPSWQLLERFPAVGQDGIFGRYVEVVETGESLRFETQYNADGVTGWYDVSVVKLGDGFVITFNDISSRKEALSETASQRTLLDQQAAFLQGVLDASISGIISMDALRSETGALTDFRFTTANRASFDLLGKTADALIGGTLLTIFPGNVESGLFDFYRHCADTRTPNRTETYYRHDGLDFWLDVTAEPLGDGLVITFTDISESRRARQAMEHQASLLSSVLDGSLNAIMAYESVRDAAGTLVDFRVVAANRSAEEYLQMSAGELLGGLLLTLFPEEKEMGLFDRYVRTVETGEPLRVEAHYTADGQDSWLDISATQLGDGFVVTFIDSTERRRAQEAIEAAAVRLQGVIDVSQTGIFLFEPIYDAAGRHVDFRFKTINRMVAALVGQTPEVLTGATASEWFISYRETGLFDRYRHTLETGEEQRFDINYNVDGFDVWFDVKSVRFGTDVLVTFTDYTDLKQAQRAVEQQASLLNSVLDGSINGIMAFASVRDDTGRIVDFTFISANEASCRMVSRTVDELIGTRLLTHFPGNVESGLFAQYVRTVEEGVPTRTETYYNADGLDFWLDISARQLGDGFVVTFTDTSEIKRAAHQVQQAAEALQTVIDTSQTGIFLFTPVRNQFDEVIDFRFRLANRMLAAYVGQDPGTVIGALGSTWFPDYHTNGLFEHYRDTYLTGRTDRFDFHYEGNGIDAWLDILSTKMGDEVLVTFSDYTPLKKLQLELEGTVQKLQLSNENLERFAYVASHDLQEPLRKIQSFGDMIMRRHGEVLPPDAADKIGRMQGASERMQALIRDLLAFSRVTSSHNPFTAVDLNSLLTDIRNDLEVPIRERRAQFHVDPLPTVQGDTLQLRQLFQNLLSNALKFTPPGTPPRVRVHHRTLRGTAAPHIAGLQPQQRYHEISVSDAGIGFEAQYAEQIFEAFRRLHNRAEYPGTGVGLAIVKRVIDNHSGGVGVESQPGKGTTFRVYLPV
jgi:PAS domain S-box-containing protein